MKINFAAVRSSPEYTSAMIRYGFWLLSTVFIGLAMWTNYYEPLWEFYLLFALSYLAYTTLVFVSILYKPYIRVRPYLTIPFDVAAISLAMLFTEDGPFSPFFLFYPWYFVSYAIRYGRGPLLVAAMASMVSFVVVLVLTDTWYSHVYDVIAYIVFLIVMPFYLDIMLRRMNKARDEANRANKAKSEFLAAMSHEIRTPMSGIVGVSSLLEKTELNDNQKEYVSALQESSTALNALIDDVLDLSKIEAGKYSLETERFNLPKTLFGVAQMFTATANAKGLELFFDYASDLPDHVYGDSKRLRQIVLNLVSNAVKFTERGEVCIRVRSEAMDAGTEQIRIRIEVHDTGPGLSAEQKQRIFEPFYQVAGGPQRHSGTGLGTTISANLVRLMHGEIGVDSTPGQGSVFWLMIPWRYEAKVDQDYSDLAARHPLIVHETQPTSRQILQDYANGLHWSCQGYVKPADLHDAIEQQLVGDTRPIVLLSELSCAEQCTELASQLRNKYAERIHLALLLHLSRLHEISEQEHELFEQFLTLPVMPQRLRNMLLSMTDPSRAAAAVEQAHTASTVSRFLHILVAEDSPINAKVITTFLTQDGHRVDHAENGQLALEALKHNDYDMVLMDMRMPELDGLETTRQWRLLETDEQHVPIIALTANATPEDKNNCLAAGMDDFLSKPVNQEQLRKLINSLA